MQTEHQKVLKLVPQDSKVSMNGEDKINNFSYVLLNKNIGHHVINFLTSEEIVNLRLVSKTLNETISRNGIDYISIAAQNFRLKFQKEKNELIEKLSKNQNNIVQIIFQ